MHIKLILGLSCGAFLGTVVAQASVVENLNRKQETFLYVVQKGRVWQYSCPGKPSVGVRIEDCVRTPNGSISLKKMEKEVRKAAQPEIARLKARVPQLKTEWAEVTRDLESQQQRLRELQALIEKLQAQSPQSPELSDYRKSEKALEVLILQLESREAQAKSDFLAAGKDAEQAETGWEALFEPGNQLAQEVPIAVDRDASNFTRLRPYIKQFFHVLAKAAGTSYGPNTWFDSVTHRVWFTDYRSGSWDRVTGSCPAGYEQPDWDKEFSGQEAAVRLQEAQIYEETGFKEALFFFWGSWCHSYSSGTTWRGCNPASKAWIYSLWDFLSPQRYEVSQTQPWVYGSLPGDGTNVLMMCVSSKADP